jgi:hypothetical protein
MPAPEWVTYLSLFAATLGGRDLIVWCAKQFVTEKTSGIEYHGQVQERAVREIERRLSDHIQDNLRTETQLIREIKDAVSQIQKAVVDIQVMAHEQAVINQMATRTLQSLLDRTDAHTQAITMHAERLDQNREKITEIGDKVSKIEDHMRGGQ